MSVTARLTRLERNLAARGARFRCAHCRDWNSFHIAETTFVDTIAGQHFEAPRCLHCGWSPDLIVVTVVRSREELERVRRCEQAQAQPSTG